MNISVLGCGRWGSFHSWYANHIGHVVTLWGRESSANLKRLKKTRQNDYLTLPPEVTLTSDLARAVKRQICASFPLRLRNFAVWQGN